MRLSLPLFFTALLALAGAGCAHNRAVAPATGTVPAQTVAAPAPPPDTAAVRAEQIRTECIQGRRLICGRVLAIVPGGLVVDSGYTDLLHPPLSQSWVIPGNVSVTRNPNVLELNTPGTACLGLVFLTDTSKRQKPKQYDYVVIMGYPAGQYDYSPLPGVVKTIRKFSAGLPTAVKLRLQAEQKNPEK